MGSTSDLVFLNPRLTASAAFDMGLISAVFSNERFEEEVRGLARKLADGPTGAYAVAKRLINESALVERLDPHLDRELDELSRVANGGDFAEGIDSFFAKRPPRFGGPSRE